MTLDVLAVARLLADEHHAGSLRSLAEDRLRRVAIQVAALTALDGLGEGVQGAFRGEGSVCGVLGHPERSYPVRSDREHRLTDVATKLRLEHTFDLETGHLCPSCTSMSAPISP